MKSHSEAAIERASQIAAKYGIVSARKEESERLLWQKFDGNVLQIQQTIAYYDEHDDEIVFNHAHPAWGDMREFVRSLAKRYFYSTGSPDHFVRHEIGHALHYRGMTDAERAEIWYKELAPDEKVIAVGVGINAADSRVEFVAEVYAGLWARRKFHPQVLSLYEKLRGPWR